MGDIADAMLNGEMCEQCGEYIDDGNDGGYPRKCAGCSLEDQLDDPFVEARLGGDR